MPDRVAGIPADGEGIDEKRDLFMSVIGRIGGTEGFSFALIPEGPPHDGFRSYDSDTIAHRLSFYRAKGGISRNREDCLTLRISGIEIQTEK